MQIYGHAPAEEENKEAGLCKSFLLFQQNGN